MATDAPSSRVQAAVQGRLGILTLDRPEALNALDLGMVEQLDGTLVEWNHDSHVHAVLIRSSGERAFCAGGDMRAIGTPSDPSERVALGRAFFAAEYRLNYRINMFRSRSSPSSTALPWVGDLASASTVPIAWWAKTCEWRCRRRRSASSPTSGRPVF